jgi:hypothetical protein
MPGVGLGVDRDHRGEGSGESGKGQTEHHVLQSHLHGEHGAEGGARSHPEQAGVGHGVPKERLEGGSDQA